MKFLVPFVEQTFLLPWQVGVLVEKEESPLFLTTIPVLWPILTYYASMKEAGWQRGRWGGGAVGGRFYCLLIFLLSPLYWKTAFPDIPLPSPPQTQTKNIWHFLLLLTETVLSETGSNGTSAPSGVTCLLVQPVPRITPLFQRGRYTYYIHHINTANLTD